MKLKDKKELHTKEISELEKFIREGQSLLFSLRLDQKQNKLKDTRSLYNIRKRLATIKTILREKEALKNG